MNRSLKSKGFFQDDRGVALTEFVIVIPFVLLFFFAMLQYYEIVRTAQLANYGAYIAARSYSVRAAADKAPDSFGASDAAKFAAAWALAPVSNVSGLPGSSDSSATTLLANAARGVILLSLGGFNASTNAIGSHISADVSINYPQAINVPVFASIWNFVSGSGSKIDTSLWPLDNAAALGLSLATGTPYVNIQSKSSTGCEEWSGVMRARIVNPDSYNSSSDWGTLNHNN